MGKVVLVTRQQKFMRVQSFLDVSQDSRMEFMVLSPWKIENGMEFSWILLDLVLGEFRFEGRV